MTEPIDHPTADPVGSVPGMVDTAVTAATATINAALSAVREPRLFRLGDSVASGVSTDKTSALQTFFNGLVDGDEVTVDNGTWRMDGTLTISKNNVTVRLRKSGILDRSSGSATVDGILVTGTGVRIIGHGTITSPATFDGTNVQPTYAVVRVTGDGGKVRDLTLTNVPKVGIYFDDTDQIDVSGVKIVGNYPAGSYTGTQTGHFGIAYNPGTSGADGRGKINNNRISGCVQGIALPNYGAAVDSYGLTITGNTISGCHNHGVYGVGGVDAVTVTGNAFARCGTAVALIGSGHVVSGNTIYTTQTGTNADVTGISMRESIDCAITGNTVKGDGGTGAVVIETANYTGTETSRNTISGNVVDVTGGTSMGIRVGRSGQTATCHDNIVSGNTVRSVGAAGLGLICLNPDTGAASWGNKIIGNTVVVKGEAHGINATNTSHATIQNNSVRFEYDAGSAKTLAGVHLSSATRCTVSLNDIHCPATFGTNVALRGVWENTGSDFNRLVQNGYHGDLTKLTSFTPVVLVTNSNTYLDERGTGSPSGAFFGAPGSRWSRDDGGAATSLYIKETANTSATWAAK